MTRIAMLQRSRQRIRFGNEDTDFLRQWMLGCHTYSAASTGGLFIAASKVENGEPESWTYAFGGLGARLKEQAGKLKAAHGYVDNFPLLQQMLFDWLDETYA